MEERNFVILTAAHPDFSNEEVRFVSSGFVSENELLQHYSGELYAVVPESAFECEPSFFREKTEVEKTDITRNKLITRITEQRKAMMTTFFSNPSELQVEFSSILPQINAALDLSHLNCSAFNLAQTLLEKLDLSHIDNPESQTQANDLKNRLNADIQALKTLAAELPE